MLVGEIVAVLVVVGLAAAALFRRRSHDDEYSVEHYHRQLHTLEEMRTHPADGPQIGNDDASSSYPTTAFRASGSSNVRLTEPGRSLVPPVPPPPVANPAEPVAFDDEKAPEAAPSTFMSGSDDRAMHGINHRPRRLGAPLAAVAAVLVLIAVLIAAGIHSNTPSHGKATNSATTTPAPSNRSHGSHGSHGPGRHPDTSTTSTTATPAVSTPQSSSAHTATYQVASADYSLDLAATKGECWVEATNTATGSVLFTATLFSGQSHTVAASGPVTVTAGAPGAFAATVDGAAVSLPPGNQAPFTLHFVTASTGAGAGGSAGTAGTTGAGGTAGTTGGTGAGGLTTPTT